MHFLRNRWILLGLALLSCASRLHGQAATVHGQVKDSRTSNPVELVTIYIQGTQQVTETDERGNYTLGIPADTIIVLVFTRLGYEDLKRQVGPFVSGRRVRVDATLEPTDQEIEIEVKDKQIQNAGAVRQDVDVLKTLPTTTGNLESVLPHIALGTSSGSGGELTSQYSVRGGNYDENLVYVNDFEIYRPQLIRAGQQEGLSFPNIDLIRDLQFSSGGFQAKYGDKLSSVLDISYKRPDSTRFSVGASLLGGSLHWEGAKVLGQDNYRRFRYLLGARYKDTRYILGSLDLAG
ncbi:MAG: carboxypeptidase-like regulatory domain-containing protein, partial [Saprospiraceae bacterium]|nr:carboxypeptidase-like regulatory domain-containing protein [Saprospiraceae bacterium]